MKVLWFLPLALALSPNAQETLDEESLFDDPGALVMDSSAIPRDTIEETAGLRASGSVTSAMGLQWSRTQLRHSAENPDMHSQSVAVLDLDARSPQGARAFAALEGGYQADSQSTEAHLRELFVDFTLGPVLYMRAGKQVLQWGRCYFWNPSDLINLEHRDLVERLGSREGTYGWRAHLPIGTRANFYAFLYSQDAGKASELQGSFKAEALLGPSEASLSLWKREGLDPALAGDISSRVAGWDLSGEAILLPGGFLPRYTESLDTLFSKPSPAWAPRLCISLGRSFDFMDLDDRLHVQYEMYYNSLGYAHSPLDDSRSYVFAEPGSMEGLPVRAGPKALWLYSHGALGQYELGRYYAAFFASCQRFLVADLTLGLDGVANLDDHSALIAASLSYSTLQQLDLGLSLSSMGGRYPGEFNALGTRLQTQASAAYRF